MSSVGDITAVVPVVGNGSEEAMLAIRDLGDHALSTVLELVGVERMFLRKLSLLEISGLCCAFPKVRDWFMEHHSAIGVLPRSLDVTSLFNRVPGSAALKPLLEAFKPHSVVIRFGDNVGNPCDILTAFDPLKPFFSLQVVFDRSDLILLPARYRVSELSIVHNKWSPACAAAHSVLSGMSGAKVITLTNGYFDVVMAAHLEHHRFYRLNLCDVGVSQFEIPQIVTWLVSREHLTHLSIIDYPYWVKDTNDVRFMRLLLSRISELKGLISLEFSIGGRYTVLSGLLQLRHLKTLHIHLEIHLGFGLQGHLLWLLRGLRRKSITIEFYCGQDWACNRRLLYGRSFIRELKEKFPRINFLSGRGLREEEIALAERDGS